MSLSNALASGETNPESHWKNSLSHIEMELLIRPAGIRVGFKYFFNNKEASYLLKSGHTLNLLSPGWKAENIEFQSSVIDDNWEVFSKADDDPENKWYPSQGPQNS